MAEDVREYFRRWRRVPCRVHFPLMPNFMAVRWRIVSDAEILRQTRIFENCQWAIFLRNHDELALEMVTDKERDYITACTRRSPVASHVGIRRRLAPLRQ